VTEPRSDEPRTGGNKDVRLVGVSKRFPVSKKETLLAVDRIDLHVSSNEFLAIIGPSGCGKSTILRMVA